ncbi:MAG: endonuclease/exonuclease/phosphatase family protein, partial [Pseudomonadota bacterium]
NLLSLLARHNHWFELLSHFRLHYALIAGVFAAGLFSLRKPATAIVMVLVALANIAVIYPYLSLQVRDSKPGHLRILAANVLTTNQDYAPFIALVRKHQPDLVFVQEADQSWLDALGQLEADYPQITALARDDNFGIAALSRTPDTRLEVITIKPADLPAIAASLIVNGQRLNMLAMHTLPPIGPQRAKARNQQLQASINYLSGLPKPHVLLGDFNITPWSPFFKDTLKAGGLRDGRIGYGMNNTWPAGFAFAGIPIDHFLLSSGAVVTGFSVSENYGSDHRALIVDIAVVKP